MSHLADHIAQTRLIDTHEHLSSEQEFVEGGPDLLQDLFDNYIQADLLVAGASAEAVRHLLDASDPDLAGRLAGMRDAWQRCRHTGYGEAVRLLARQGRVKLIEVNGLLVCEPPEARRWLRSRDVLV